MSSQKVNGAVEPQIFSGRGAEQMFHFLLFLMEHSFSALAFRFGKQVLRQ
jgi:hypothetical protein